jgi:cyclophilin family peptidyl-prolyl cis-trans isomerase
VPSDKRQRQKEGQRARLEAARAEARRRQRRRQLVSGATFVGVIALIIVVLYFVQGGKSSDKTASATTTTSPAAPATYGTGDCPPLFKPATLPKTFAAAPKNCLTEGATYKAVINTNLGVIKVDLDVKGAPITVNNFVALARWGWFDGEGFHRVVKGFVDQAGDAAGRGNPGYKIPDELPKALSDYPKGTLAMANAGVNTGGSQWFICVDCSNLPGPDFAVFGHVTEGLDVVDAINALADPSGAAAPTKPVTISKVEIDQS